MGKWRDLLKKGTHKHTETYLIYFKDHRNLSLSEESKCMWKHGKDGASNTGRNKNGGPVARRKKMDFKNDIGEFGVQLGSPYHYLEVATLSREPQQHWQQRQPVMLESGFFLLPPFLPTAVLKSAGRITPEDAAHRWWQNIKNISQN